MTAKGFPTALVQFSASGSAGSAGVARPRWHWCPWPVAAGHPLPVLLESQRPAAARAEVPVRCDWIGLDGGRKEGKEAGGCGCGSSVRVAAGVLTLRAGKRRLTRRGHGAQVRVCRCLCAGLTWVDELDGAVDKRGGAREDGVVVIRCGTPRTGGRVDPVPHRHRPACPVNEVARQPVAWPRTGAAHKVGHVSYICACACACVRARVCVCVRVCVLRDWCKHSPQIGPPPPACVDAVSYARWSWKNRWYHLFRGS